MSKEIQLTQGKVALVDDADFDLVNEFKWHFTGGRVGYALRNEKRNGVRLAILMHRFITGPAKGQVVDHINWNGLDNTRNNLRVCTRSENLMNQRLHKNSRTGYPGITWEKREKVFRARIWVNGKQVHLGYTKDLQEAVAMRKAAVKKFHGEFAPKSRS